MKRTYNVHKFFIYNIGIPKHKNTYDFFVQVRNFLLPLSLKVFRHKERDTVFLCWLFHLPQTTCDTCRQASASKRKSTVFFRGKAQLTDFSQISPNHPRTLPVHDVIHIPWLNFLSGIFILTSVNDTSSPCARQHLRSSLHLTNPCAKRKVLSITKPKGRIYKTKSLGHYITQHYRSLTIRLICVIFRTLVGGGSGS